MSAQLVVEGTLSTTPSGSSTGVPAASAALSARDSVTVSQAYELMLTADPEVTLSLPSGGVHVLYLTVEGGVVRVRITSADGTDQALPVDSTLLLRSIRSPYTAVKLTRTAGVDTRVGVMHATL